MPDFLLFPVQSVLDGETGLLCEPDGAAFTAAVRRMESRRFAP